MIIWSTRLLTSTLFWLRWRNPRNDYFELYDPSSQLAHIYFSTVTAIEIIVSSSPSTTLPTVTSISMFFFSGSNIIPLLPSPQAPSYCPSDRYSNASLCTLSFNNTTPFCVRLRQSRRYTSPTTIPTQIFLRTTRPSRLPLTLFKTRHNTQEPRLWFTIPLVQPSFKTTTTTRK